MTYDFKPAKAGGQAPRLSKEEYAQKKRAIIYSNIILKIILIQAIIGYFSIQLRQTSKIKLNNMVRH